jgi:hypothetical protein
MTSKVIRCAAISLVGFGLAFVKAGGEPAAEFGVVPKMLCELRNRNWVTGARWEKQ